MASSKNDTVGTNVGTPPPGTQLQELPRVTYHVEGKDPWEECLPHWQFKACTCSSN